MKSKVSLIASVSILMVVLLASSRIEHILDIEEYPEAILTVIGALIVLAGVISYQTGVSTSIIELIVGSLAALTPLSMLADNPTLNLLSRIGAIVLMFIAGTEIDIYVLRRTFKESLVLGLLSFFLPFMSAHIFLNYTGYSGLKNLLVSTGVATTSVAILYMALKDLGIFRSWLGQTMFAGAMITDILSMVALSLILGRFSTLSMLYPLIILVIIIVLPPLLDKIVKLESSWDLELKFILLLLLVLALISEGIGVHSAITSFLLGIAFSETVKSHEYLEGKIKGLGFAFFIPIFFFKAGLLMNFGSLLKTIDYFIILALIAIVAKYIGAYIPLRMFFKVKEHKLAFLFNARLAIGTLAAIYGLEYGIIGEAEYSIIIGLVVLSSIPVAIAIHKMPPISIEEPL